MKQKSNNTWLIVGIVVVILVIAGVFFMMNKSPGSSQSPVNKVADNIIPSQTLAVEITASGFSPASLNLRAGDTVVWTNKDTKQHTVTSDKGDELSSKILSNGMSFTHTFNTAGTFNYHCEAQPSLKAVVIVA